MSATRIEMVTTGLISAFLASGLALMLAYHAAILVPQPDESRGYLYAFPTKGGYKYTTGATLNQLSLSAVLVLIFSAILIFSIAKFSSFREKSGDIGLDKKLISFTVGFSIIFSVVFYYTILALASGVAENSIFLEI
jgi:nitric oxide reductase large subunit